MEFVEIQDDCCGEVSANDDICDPGFWETAFDGKKLAFVTRWLEEAQKDINKTHEKVSKAWEELEKVKEIVQAVNGLAEDDTKNEK
jgi:hypothetical protein